MPKRKLFHGRTQSYVPKERPVEEEPLMSASRKKIKIDSPPLTGFTAGASEVFRMTNNRGEASSGVAETVNEERS